MDEYHLVLEGLFPSPLMTTFQAPDLSSAKRAAVMVFSSLSPNLLFRVSLFPAGDTINSDEPLFSYMATGGPPTPTVSTRQ